MNQYKKLDPATATDDEIVICAMAIEKQMTNEEKTEYIVESFLFFLYASRMANQKGAETAEAWLGNKTTEHFFDTINNLQSDKVLIKGKPTHDNTVEKTNR